MAGGPGHFLVQWPSISATHKYISGNLPTAEVWRTAVAPGDDAPFYLVSSRDSSVTPSPNGYCTVDTDTFTDEFTDATATGKENNPENGAILESLAPPAATIIRATADRLFLAGIAGDPDRVWYSKRRGIGEVVSFHDALTFDVPRDGGDITAIAFNEGTLVVFRETAIYAFPGQGFDNAGGGENFGPANIISLDVGAVGAEAVAQTPQGHVFKSRKGWYMLRGWTPDYIGAPVAGFDDDDVKAVDVIESQHQIRVLTDDRMLVLDYLVNQWSEWTIDEGRDSTMWQGAHYYVNDDEILAQASTYAAGVDYGWDIETAWIPMATMQSAGRLRFFEVLGEYLSTFHLWVRVARDYQYASADVPLWEDSDYWTPSPTTVGSALQVQHFPREGRCQAFKIRLTAVSASNHDDPPAGAAAKLTGLSLELGFDRGLNRRLTAAQKQ